MSTCKDCIHYDVCKYRPLAIGVDICDIFKNIIDVVPRAEVIEEYRKKVYAKMGKYTVFGREYIQRIMREVEKELKGGE